MTLPAVMGRAEFGAVPGRGRGSLLRQERPEQGNARSSNGDNRAPGMGPLAAPLTRATSGRSVRLSVNVDDSGVTAAVKLGVAGM